MAKGNKAQAAEFTGTVCGVSTLKPLGKDEGVGNMFVKLTVKVPVNNIDLNQMAQFQKRGDELVISLQPEQGELPGTGTEG